MNEFYTLPIAERERCYEDLDLARATTCLGWMHTRSETETAGEMTSCIVELVFSLVEGYLGHP